MEGRAEQLFRAFGKKVDELIEDLKSAKDNAGEEYKTRFEELKKNKDSLKKEFEGFKEKHKDKIEEAEQGMARVADEIKQAFETIVAPKNRNDKDPKP